MVVRGVVRDCRGVGPNEIRNRQDSCGGPPGGGEMRGRTRRLPRGLQGVTQMVEVHIWEANDMLDWREIYEGEVL